MFKLYCNKNDAHFQEVAILTSGRVGERISFTFSPDWDGLLKTVVFIAGKESRDVVLTEDTCNIPPEVLVFPGENLRVGVFGETADKTLVIPTIYASAGIIRPGASPSGMSSTPPTPSWPEQVQAIATEAKDVADSVRNGADGKSAYQYAVEGGYTGTEAEFAAKLAKEKFTNPNALTFTGAVTGTYDGSEPLSVDIPSGGGEKAWTLISTVEVGADELVASIKTPTEDEMKLYSEIFCRFTSFTKTKDGEDTTSPSSFRPFIDRTYGDFGRISGDVTNCIGTSSSSRTTELYCTIKANCISGYAQNSSPSVSSFAGLKNTFNQFQNIPQIIFNNNNAYYYCSGTKLEVWAR